VRKKKEKEENYRWKFWETENNTWFIQL